MHPSTVEKTLKHILEIDRKAVQVEEEAIVVEKAKEKELKKEFRNIEFATMKKARKAAKEAYQAMMEEATLEEEKLLQRGEEECERLHKLLESNKDAMVKQVVVYLFEERGGSWDK